MQLDIVQSTREQQNKPASPTHRALYANCGSQVAIRGRHGPAGPMAMVFYLSLRSSLIFLDEIHIQRNQPNYQYYQPFKQFIGKINKSRRFKYTYTHVKAKE